ncbi:hypothetical protein F5984_02175 [Rudanella paleaurantiibacter]|uniref:Uncharacterized protein n=1 Tax=Rudanella paleaurantiibacter TaxID=2614655 RepID=A0A7J5U6K2_9BACT|nr:hypothetical protein [Rudanella paleaurantiibacter]KAB7732780.1 hypothetical protein F5984_02175 [Rudanella paleaurantiibacter]
MKPSLFLASLSLLAAPALAQTVIPAPDIQIKTAVLAAPTDKKDGATVIGYDTDGKYITLRKGTNDLVCLTDDPNQKGFSAACYHESLEPFMAWGRKLRMEGKKGPEMNEQRDKDAKAGKFKMPKQPATLFVFSAPSERYDATTGTVTDGNLRYVVYIANATAQSTGLPTKAEVPGMPWIMDAGTYRAHIMITPPAK